MQRYPETLEAWKKSRNSTRLSQALLLTDVAATLVLLSTKSEKVIMASLAVGVGALITLNLYQETRNLHMLYAVQLYNKKIREELDKSNAPAP